MGHRYGRSEIRQDFAWARARAADSQWAADDTPPCEMTELEEQVRDDLLELLTESVAHVSGRYLDPQCRHLRHPAHVCHDREGQPLRQFGSCWLEARLQILEQSAVVRAAGLAAVVRP